MCCVASQLERRTGRDGAALRSSSQAAISLMRVCLSGMRRSRHWDERTASSDSAISSQLPCFGVSRHSKAVLSGARSPGRRQGGLPQEVITREGTRFSCRAIALRRRHGGLRERPSLGASDPQPRARCSVDSTCLRQTFRQAPKERRGRRGGDR